MKSIVKLTALLLMVSSCSNSSKIQNKDVATDHEGVDTMLIQKLGADKYGMKSYVLAFLKAGPIRNQDSATAAELQKKHLQNITRLAEAGKLVLAGPFLDDQKIKGIYIFNTHSIEEAKRLTESDPAIKAGRLEMELHPWYGSAALQKLNKWHKALETVSVSQ
jgi:uncharacterized protein YciI